MQRVWIERQLARHKADLYVRSHSVFQEPIVDLVRIREVINRIAVLILVVYADLVVQNGMESHVLEIRDLLHRAQVIAIALAQAQNRASGTKHLFPQ